MKSLSFLMCLGCLSLSNLAMARPKTLTVVTHASELLPTTLTLREQTTRPWLPGCKWPDVLQNTGWFPATFYFESKPTQIVDNASVFEFKKRSPLAIYCDAKTDNVANSLSLEVQDSKGQATAYAGISYTLGTGSSNSAVVHCKKELSPEGVELFECESAQFNNDENYSLTVIVD